jgi:phosphatidylglycerol lysyltransferase
LAVAAQGVINLLSAFLSHPPERLVTLRRLVPTAVIDTSRTFTLLTGLLLLITAWGLRSGKRRAFVWALFLCAVSVPVNLLKAIDLEEAIAAASLMFLLGISADSFPVKSRELSLRALRVRGIATAVGFLIYAVVGCWVLESQFGNGASVSRATSEAIYTLTGLGRESLVLRTDLTLREQRIVRWYLNSLHITAATLLVGLCLAALRPVAHRGRHRSEQGRVGALLQAYGDSSVSAFALAPDSDYFFSRNARAVLAYRFESNVLLGIGDPIGPEEELPGLLDDFAKYARARDWDFALFQARPERLPLYEQEGWRAIHIGEDPMLDPNRFSLEGSAMGEIRRAVRKLEQAGWEVLHFIPSVNPFDPARAPEGLLDQLRSISNEWLRDRPGAEKGFCMGRFDPDRLSESWLAVAWRPAERTAAAFVSWVPIWARRGWALDLMRRRRSAPNGAMEFLIAKSVEASRERGDGALSLSLSALAKTSRPGETLVAPAAIRAADVPERIRTLLMDHLSRFYDFGGLFHWKKKFVPRFEDRYLVYPDPLSLPRVVLALVRAQSPGGLWPYVREVFGGHRGAEQSAAGNPPGGEG